MKICNVCGSENADENRFCEDCGAELESAEKEPSPKKKVIIGVAVALLAIAAVIAVIVGTGEDTEAQYNEKITQADRYMENMDYERAESAYMEAIKIEPKKKKPYLRLSEVYAEQEKFDKAVEILNDGIEAVDGEAASELEESLERIIYEPVKQDYRDQVTLLFQVGGDPNPDWESLEGKIEFDYSYMPLFGDIEEIYGDENYGFAYEDLDGNGTEELLVFIDGRLQNIWTNDGRKAVRLLEPAEGMETLTIRDDGKLFRYIGYGQEYSEGLNADYYLYEISDSGTELKEVDHIMMMVEESAALRAGDYSNAEALVYYEKEDGTRAEEDDVLIMQYGDSYSGQFLDSYGTSVEEYDIEYLFQ